MSVYVAPNGSGSDSNNGTPDQPFASFSRACEAVRASKTAEDKTIIARGSDIKFEVTAARPSSSRTYRLQ